MTSKEIMAALFVQAWWSYLIGDEADAIEILMNAYNLYYLGFPCPTQETLQ